MTIWRCYEAAAELKAGVPAAGGSAPLPGKPCAGLREKRSWHALQRERPRRPSRRQGASRRHNQLGWLTKKRGKQDFFGYTKGQRNMLREEIGEVFSGTLFIWHKAFRERPLLFTLLAQPRKQSLSSAAQFEAKFSSVERIQPTAGKACLDHSTLPKKEKLRGVRSASVAPTSTKSP